MGHLSIEDLEQRISTLERTTFDARIPLLSNDLEIEDALFSNHATYIVKTSDETVTSSTTLQNDNQLLFPVGSFQHWGFEFFIIWDSTTAGDIKFSVTVPASAGGEWVLSKQEGAQTGEPTYRGGAAFGTATGIAADASATKYGAHIFGSVLTVATSGDVTLQWTQNTSNGTPATVYTHSWLKAVRID